MPWLHSIIRGAPCGFLPKSSRSLGHWDWQKAEKKANKLKEVSGLKNRTVTEDKEEPDGNGKHTRSSQLVLAHLLRTCAL